MRKLLLGLGALIIAALSQPATAQMVETKITASNGVVVDVASDDFAGRKEYTAPVINFGAPGSGASGFLLVAQIKRGDTVGALNFQGGVAYGGEWHYYSSAIFKGGDAVPYEPGERKVLSCSYGCSYSEGFFLKPSLLDISRHLDGDKLAIQLRPKDSTETLIVEIPRSYIDAVLEVSGSPSLAAAAAPPPKPVDAVANTPVKASSPQNSRKARR